MSIDIKASYEYCDFMGEQGELEHQPEGEREITVDPFGSLFENIADTYARAKYHRSMIDLDKMRSEGYEESLMADRWRDEAWKKAIEVVGQDPEFNQQVDALRNLPREELGDVLDRMMRKNDGFRLRFEAFLQEVGDTPYRAEAYIEGVKYERAEAEKERIATAVDPIEKKTEEMTDSEVRQEIVRRVQNALGKLMMGPVADSLVAGYLQYVKVMDHQTEELKGVQLNLFGIREELKKFYDPREDENFKISDNLSYFIPADETKPGKLLTESFLDNIQRVSPEAYQFFFEQMEKDNVKGVRDADGKDLRDALNIIRGSDHFVKEIIYRTPAKLWGRPGITD